MVDNEHMSLSEPEDGRADELSQADVRVNPLRLAGGLIDVLLLAGVFLVISVASGRTHTGPGNVAGVHTSSVQFGFSTGALLLCFALWLAYFWVLESAFGRTLGKFVCGLRVIDRNGRTPHPAAVLLRTLGRILDALPVLYLFGVLVMVFGGQPSRRIGDRLAGTAVVRG
jgi:uncharacterized RDD family membrane protein YckC